MLGEEDKNRDAFLLIYLPCYLDFELAVMQATRIREIANQQSSTINFKIKTMISINGVELSNSEKDRIKKSTDYQVFTSFGISGDINITQGFMHAIRLGADYLWILSSNDEVGSAFISTVQEKLVNELDVDILVGCTSEQLELRKVNSVFDKENRDIPFGLISSVVYRTLKMSKNFDTATQMNWTGWGQLATIEASCISLGGIQVALVREEQLYKRSIRGIENSELENERIRNGYAHSFFGMPIVISTLHAGNPRRRRSIINSWIRSNWYLVNYFIKTDFKLWSSHIASNQIWLRQFGFSAVKAASPMYRALFTLARYINIERQRNSKLARALLDFYRGKV
jgi:hypothetical protein